MKDQRIAILFAGQGAQIVGLRAVGIPADDPMIARGAEWLTRHQQTSGG